VNETERRRTRQHNHQPKADVATARLGLPHQDPDQSNNGQQLEEHDQPHQGRCVLQRFGIADRRGSSHGHRKRGQTRKCRNGPGPPSPPKPYNKRQPGHPEDRHRDEVQPRRPRHDQGDIPVHGLLTCGGEFAPDLHVVVDEAAPQHAPPARQPIQVSRQACGCGRGQHQARGQQPRPTLFLHAQTVPIRRNSGEPTVDFTDEASTPSKTTPVIPAVRFQDRPPLPRAWPLPDVQTPAKPHEPSASERSAAPLGYLRSNSPMCPEQLV
jgi:hypothetical protein